MGEEINNWPCMNVLSILSGRNLIVVLFGTSGVQVGNHIDVASGDWVALEAGIGGNIDSYYEYLLKGGILFNRPHLLHQFEGPCFLI